MCGLTKGYCGKKVSGYVRESRDAMLANILRMTLCIAIGFVFVIAIDGASGFNIGGLGILISIISEKTGIKGEKTRYSCFLTTIVCIFS